MSDISLVEQFYVMRLDDGYAVVRVWWFAPALFHGRLVLERYQEYHLTAWHHDGDHEYRLAEELSRDDGTADSAQVPADVLREAASKVSRAVH